MSTNARYMMQSGSNARRGCCGTVLGGVGAKQMGVGARVVYMEANEDTARQQGRSARRTGLEQKHRSSRRQSLEKRPQVKLSVKWRQHARGERKELPTTGRVRTCRKERNAAHFLGQTNRYGVIAYSTLGDMAWKANSMRTGRLNLRKDAGCNEITQR
jgi:hypothetical protein